MTILFVTAVKIRNRFFIYFLFFFLLFFTFSVYSFVLYFYLFFFFKSAWFYYCTKSFNKKLKSTQQYGQGAEKMVA